MKNLKMKISLFGKHPSNNEYIHNGENSVFMNSVISWIEKGYEAYLQNRTLEELKKIQHFCFINTQTDSFICGNIKPSKDRQSRKYPLIVAIEVSPCSTFKTQEDIINYSENLNKKILKILEEEYSLEGLKAKLSSLYENKNFIKETKNKISAIFTNEDFSISKTFYRPLEVDDFRDIME